MSNEQILSRLLLWFRRKLEAEASVRAARVNRFQKVERRSGLDRRRAFRAAAPGRRQSDLDRASEAWGAVYDRETRNGRGSYNLY